MIDDAPTSIWRRLTWFVGLWAASVLSLALVATAIRWALHFR